MKIRKNPTLFYSLKMYSLIPNVFARVAVSLEVVAVAPVHSQEPGRGEGGAGQLRKPGRKQADRRQMSLTSGPVHTVFPS